MPVPERKIWDSTESWIGCSGAGVFCERSFYARRMEVIFSIIYGLILKECENLKKGFLHLENRCVTLDVSYRKDLQPRRASFY